MAETPWYHNEKKLRKAFEAAGEDWNALAAQSGGVAARTLREWGAQFGIKAATKHGEVPGGIKPIGSEVDETEILREENARLKQEVAAARKLEVFDHKALRVLEENVVGTEAEYEPLDLPVDTALTEHVHVLQYSDLHAAERVSLAAMNGLNEYNRDIMLERHQTLAAAIRSFKRNRPYPIRELVVLGLGDMVTGDIHDELRETNEEVATEAAVRLGYDMAEFVATELRPLYDKIRIHAVVGNHGRTDRKPQFKNANKNWDWIAYKVMELRLEAYDDVSIELPVGYELLTEVCGKQILLFHGDGIPTNMPDVPWGGIKRRVREKSDTYAAMGIRIDHFALGHFHEANVVSQKRILMNGSIKGPDEYSLKRYGGGQPPCQLLHTFHPDRGLVGTDYLML